MSEAIHNWILGLTAVSMILAITENIVQEGIYKRFAALAGGLVLILVTIAPVADFDVNVLMKDASRFEDAVYDEMENLELKKKFLYESVIAEHAQAYILDKASELGIYCEASVSVAWDEDGPAPHSVVIKGSCDHDQYLALSELIEMELGIPRALQRFEEAG